jgi:hypothetical protein
VSTKRHKVGGGITRATDLNVWTMGRVFGDAVRVPNRLEPTSVAGMRRCVAAGLVRVEGQELALTEEGMRRLAEHRGA